MSHTWRCNDDVLAFYLYRYGEDNLISKDSVARYIGFNDTGSLNMRIGNFKAVDGQGGLRNWARLTEQVYNQYQNINQCTHRKQCFKIMGIA